jgi:hypothetical protein
MAGELPAMNRFGIDFFYRFVIRRTRFSLRPNSATSI